MSLCREKNKSSRPAARRIPGASEVSILVPVLKISARGLWASHRPACVMSIVTPRDALPQPGYLPGLLRGCSEKNTLKTVPEASTVRVRPFHHTQGLVISESLSLVIGSWAPGRLAPVPAPSSSLCHLISSAIR